MASYDHTPIENKWQNFWSQKDTFVTPNPGDATFDATKPKYYVLDMFPYPSGVGLHVGHPLGYIATDIVARYKRMTGHNVLHPMGFDSFGLPAEQFAVEHGVHPRVTTEQNIANMVRQLKRLGLSYDWSRRLATTDVDYYRWTQWIFLQLYHSYFDPIDRAAKPITQLVAKLESEKYYVNTFGELMAEPAAGLQAIGGEPIGAIKWHELSEQEREGVLAGHRLAYVDEVPVNWCPALGTVLANEEVTNEGRSERGNHPVFKRPLRQWMLRITAYAERLLADLDLVDWPESIKLMQRNWIGRSEGAEVDFAIHADAESGPPDEASGPSIRVFTTRPDTLFGATYMVLAPEHPLVADVTTAAQADAVAKYQREAAGRSDVERQQDAKKKTGVFTGGYAINPVNGERIPIWIADYVMMGYGTGAIMAVPGHDERDHEFARAFGLPIVEVVRSGDGEVDIQKEAFVGEGVGVNSANDEVSLDGLPTAKAKRTITQWLESKGLGKARVQYKLRDWLFSRQRYWGEPFPMVHAPDGSLIPVDENDLPVELPEMDDFTPEASDDPQAPPRPPLARAPQSWRIVERDGERCERELNTMPQWAGSCWYYLRFCDPQNHGRFVGREAERYWMAPNGIDLYVGGAEHAVLHLLYARFWHKVLFDLGAVSTPEPFGRLFNQGYIQAYAYQDDRGIYVDASHIEEAKQGGATVYQYEGQPVTRTLGKMGKSLKNAVSPDEMCEQYGADTLRLYEMYMGPLDKSKPWETRDIVGMRRFIERVWRNFVDGETGALRVSDEPVAEGGALHRLLHKTIAAVTEDMEAMQFNTAITRLIELNNALVGLDATPHAVAEALVLMLAPFAPHLAEELWQRLGHGESISRRAWPDYDPAALVEAEVELVVQVMGRVRSKITVAADADEKTIESAALADAKIQPQIEGKTVRKVIIVPGRLVNIVAN